MPNINIFATVYKHRVSVSGEVAIIICICLDNKPIHYENTHKKIQCTDWDQFKKLSKTNKMLNAFVLQRIADLNKEYLQAELKGLKLNKAAIIKIAKGEDVGQDFIAYSKEMLTRRYALDSQGETVRTYKAEISKISNYSASQLTFADIDPKWLGKYKTYLIRELGNAENTVWKAFKFINTVFNDAIKNKLLKENPFADFDRGKYVQGNRSFLDLQDIDKLQALALTDLPLEFKTACYYYLFMCLAGFRFQDATKHFDYNLHIKNETEIVLKTQKTGAEVNIYIHKRLRIVLDFVKENKYLFSNSVFNTQIKLLAGMAGVTIPITAHTGRHTFGAMLAEMDVPIEKAQLLLGHKDPRSTKVYYHIKNKSLHNEMKKWDSL